MRFRGGGKENCIQKGQGLGEGLPHRDVVRGKRTVRAGKTPHCPLA